MDGKLMPVFRAPQPSSAPDAAAQRPPLRRVCPTRRQRRFERRLAQRRSVATAK